MLEPRRQLCTGVLHCDKAVPAYLTARNHIKTLLCFVAIFIDQHNMLHLHIIKLESWYAVRS